MAIAEIKWKLVKDTYFFDTTTCYLSENGNHMFYSGGEKRIEILIDDLNELVRKGCAMWLKLGEYEFGLDKLSKCPTTTWYGIHQMLYSLEPWGVIKESKKSARKSIKEANESVIIDGKKTNFKINDYGTFFGEKIKYMLIGKPSENEDVLADFLEENSNFEFEEYKIPYSTVYYIYNDEKSLFGVAYRHYIRLTNDEKDAKIMLAYATNKRDLYNGL